MDRRLMYVILAIVVLLLGAAVYEFTNPATFYGTRIEPPKPMPDFTLQSAQGPVSLSDFRGKYVVLYFGYTHCPDICPTTLAALKATFNRLGSRTDQAQVVFVSVDYKRDTPEKMSSYVNNFRPDFIGLAGTQDEITQVAQEYGIYFKLNDPDANGAYSVDHTSTIMILDRQGALVATWSYDQQPDEMASDLEILMGK